MQPSAGITLGVCRHLPPSRAGATPNACTIAIYGHLRSALVVYGHHQMAIATFSAAPYSAVLIHAALCSHLLPSR
jgi:hypothetical protein